MTDYSISSTNWSVGDTITVTSSNASGVGFTGWIINFNEDDYDYGLKNLDSRGKLFAFSNSPNNTLDVDITDAHSRIYTLTPVTITVSIPQQINITIKPISECLETSGVTVDIGTTITVTMNHNIYTKLKYLVNRWTIYKEDMSNKVTNISSSSTHAQYPSAKLMYDLLALKSENVHSHSASQITDSATYSNINNQSAEQNSINSAINSQLGLKEASNNKVTSWSATVNNTHYPSEKLVKDSLDTKSDTSHTHNQYLEKTTTETYTENNETLTINSIVDVVYPVGSIYMSVNSTSPQTLFGGKWEQIEDKFLLASGSTYSAGSTGGSATVSLTESQMPRHTHIQNSHNHTQNPHTHEFPHYYSAGTETLYSSSWNNQKATTQVGAVRNATATNKEATATNKYTGGTGSSESASDGSAHENMPPYLTVYVWKRIV